MRSMNRRVAVVTGASRGIAEGIALSLGEAGAIVYVIQPDWLSNQWGQPRKRDAHEYTAMLISITYARVTN